MPYIFWTLSLLFQSLGNEMSPVNFDFDAAWKKVEEFRSQGLPKSALAEVEVILEAAKKENVEVQLVKAVKVKAELTIETMENGIALAIQSIEQEAIEVKEPARQVLYSYLAEIYLGYFKQNRYMISHSKIKTSEDSGDLETWDSQQFHETILKYYLKSLEGQHLNDSVEKWEAILAKKEIQQVDMRPSLFYLLWDRVFAYLEYSRSIINLSVEGTYVIRDSKFLSGEEDFQKIPLKEEKYFDDPLYKILQGYQSALNPAGHPSSNSKADYYLQFLEFIYSNSQIPNKDSVYVTALENFVGKYKNIPYVTMAYYKLGNFYALKDNPEKAMDWYKTGANFYPDSPGSVSCKQGMNDVLRKEASVFTEEVFSKEENPRIAIDYKNLDVVQVQVFKIENKNLEIQRNESQERYNWLMQGARKVYDMNWKLPVKNKYKTNFIEGRIPLLPYGTYLVEVRGLKDSDYATLHHYCIFHVSDLAAVSWKDGKTLNYKVTERMSGKPIKKAEVTLRLLQYDYRENMDKPVSQMVKRTDKNGWVTFEVQDNQRFEIILQHGDDILHTHDSKYYSKDYFQERTSYFAEVFTDRAIYRPGHIVHFKAIAIKSEKDRLLEVVPNTDIEVRLIDANQQIVEKKSLRTNQFGSVAGSFTLPAGRLTGLYYIEVENKKGISGQKYFNVEEYKRPSFEIIPDSFKQSYALNKEVVTGGTVSNYAGNVMDGAVINYKITRGVRYIDWGWWWRPAPVYQSNEVVIGQGQAVTDKNGRYELKFLAIPDESADKQDWTVFDYKIEVIAIDHTGESQSATSDISIGYKSETLETDLPAKFDLSDNRSFQVIKKNLQGIPQSGSGTIKVEKLIEPKQFIAEPYWSQQDRDLLSFEGDNMKIMPVPTPRRYDNWPVLKKTAEQNFSTRDFISKNVFPESGVYKITLQSKDFYNREISRILYHEVSDFEEKKFPLVEPLSISYSTKTVEPGQSVELKMGATEKPVHVIVMVESQNKIVYRENFKINGSLQFQYPVKEEDRGWLYVHVLYVYKNRKYEDRTQIVVPFTNKQLEIQLETFRDKVQPGAKETYSFVVKGMKKDAVLAELLTTMFDASLETFAKNTWESSWYRQQYSRMYYDVIGFQMVTYSTVNPAWNEQPYFGMGYYNTPALENIYIYNITNNYYYDISPENVILARSKRGDAAVMSEANLEVERAAAMAVEDVQSNVVTRESAPPAARKNLNELVFFYPQLQTDAQGNVKFTFTMNEALTKWKIMSFAHTPDMKVGYNEWFVQTHKKLMVFPYSPRFVRNGDEIFFTAKVVNQENEDLPVKVEMKLTETLTGKDVTNIFVKSEIVQSATIENMGSKGFVWKFSIPEDYNGNLTWTVWGSGGGHNDGEEHVIPVLTNRQLVTETLPLFIGAKQEKTTRFTAFAQNNSSTRKDERFTLEYTSHPIWYAIQALPYLSEQGYENTEQIINRYFANALASKIANNHPKIKAVFEKWKESEPNEMASKLLANSELKSALQEETPWVLQGIEEETQKRNIALLFQNNQLSQELRQTLQKLRERQMNNGAFPWYVNGRPDLFISQYVLESIGQMRDLGIIDTGDDVINDMVAKTFSYVDAETLDQYKKSKSSGYTHQGTIHSLDIHYLYLRTLFPEQVLPAENKAMYDEYFSLAKKEWLNHNLYTQAIIGLVMNAKNDPLASKIMASFEERSFQHEELGKYWNAGNGYNWDELPIERQSKMVEFYSKMGKNMTQIIPLKIWLLKNKQSRHWATSKATSSAIYALLLEGEKGKTTHWIEENLPISVFLDKEAVEFSGISTGSGYMKKSWHQQTFPKNWANVTVANPNTSIAWGAVYYQYFEELQNIKAVSNNPLSVTKKLFVVKNNSKGEYLEEIKDSTKLKPGDRLAVKLRIRCDRSMDYVHLKDGRPAGVEPTETHSGNKYSGGLSYYENIKDLASHFYIHHLPKGDFTIEYRVKVAHAGRYSAGIATVQSMYAPEFSSHSQGFTLFVQ